MAGSDASIVLGALPVGLQRWESAGRDPARPVLARSNRDGDRETGAEAARAAAVGVARYPVDGGDVDDLLTAADRDMYAHKGSDLS